MKYLRLLLLVTVLSQYPLPGPPTGSGNLSEMIS